MPALPVPRLASVSDFDAVSLSLIIPIRYRWNKDALNLLRTMALECK